MGIFRITTPFFTRGIDSFMALPDAFAAIQGRGNRSHLLTMLLSVPIMGRMARCTWIPEGFETPPPTTDAALSSATMGHSNHTVIR